MPLRFAQTSGLCLVAGQAKGELRAKVLTHQNFFRLTWARGRYFFNPVCGIFESGYGANCPRLARGREKPARFAGAGFFVLTVRQLSCGATIAHKTSSQRAIITIIAALAARQTANMARSIQKDARRPECSILLTRSLTQGT